MSTIVSLLWPSFGVVLDQFLNIARPATVYTRSTYAGHPPEYRDNAARKGVKVESLDELLVPTDYQRISAGAAGSIDALLSRVDWKAVALEHAALGLQPDELRSNVISVAAFPTQQAMQLVEELRAAAERTPLDLIVVSEDFTALPRAVTEWGRAHGIPVLHVVHSCALIPRIYTNHRPFLSDVMAIPGERARDAYHELGIPDARLPITGNPTFDAYPSLVHSRDAIRDSVLSQLQLPASSRLIVFATTWANNLTGFSDPLAHERTFRDAVSGFAQMARKVPDTVLVIKDRPHPGGASPAVDIMRQLAPELGLDANRFRFIYNHLPHCLVAAEAAVSVDSNVSIEALLAGILPINLWTVGSWLSGPFFKPADGIVEVGASELGRTLTALFEQPDLRAEVLATGAAAAGQFQFGNDGRSAERIAAVMQQMQRKSALV